MAYITTRTEACQVFTGWVCPECSFEETYSYLALADGEVPQCPDCGEYLIPEWEMTNDC